MFGPIKDGKFFTPMKQSLTRARRKGSSFIILLFLIPVTLFAQTATNSPSPSPSPVDPTRARIDQLMADSRAQLARGAFNEVSKNALEAAALSESVGDKLRQSRALMYVALGRFHGGQIEEAIEPFEQSARLAGEAGDTRTQALALRSAATLLFHSGHYDDSLYFYDQALRLQRLLKNRAAEASVLSSMGRIYSAMHEYAQAEQVLHESLTTARELKDQLVEFSALAKLASLELTRADYRQALNYSDEAFKLTSPEIDASSKNELRYDTSIAHFGLGDYQRSADELQTVLSFLRKYKILSGEGVALGSLAQLQLRLGHSQEALATAASALTLLRRSGEEPALQANALYTEALAQKALGNNTAALENLRAAISTTERARLLSVSNEMSRAEFFSSKSDIYLATIELLATLGKTDEALAVAESYHGRAFLDSLAEARAELGRTLPRELLAREDAILSHISEIQKHLWEENISAEREQQLKKELALGEAELAQFQLEVRRADPRYASVKHPRPMSVTQIQSTLLDDQTGLLEYVVGSEKSFAWLVLKDKLFFATLPGEKALRAQVADYRNALTERPAGTSQTKAKLDPLSGQLFQILIGPFQQHLAATRKLMIIPDKSLSYLPFEALENGSTHTNEYLIEKFTINYGPSASALSEIAQTPAAAPSASIIAFGDPIYDAADVEPEKTGAVQSPNAKISEARGFALRRLPYTRTEVNNIGALFPPAQRKILVGLEANEFNLKTLPLDTYRYVHFASHGFVDEDAPSRSGIFLSTVGNKKEDGLVQMTEIMRLKLNADLVTLSACRTGMGRVVGGEGVLGLTRAFLYAGSRSVVASLWNVNDTATAELMKSFYANLRKGEAKDEALRQAKLSMLKSKQPGWRHPYYWAPFVLVGANN